MSVMEKVKDFIGITDLEEDYEEEDLVSEGNTDRNKNERMDGYAKKKQCNQGSFQHRYESLYM